MTVDEFLAWSQEQDGRYELFEGRAYAKSPQRVGHGRMKYKVQKELERALLAAGCECQMLPNGMTVRSDEYTAHEPDALVYCGPPVDDTILEISNPVVVVEVLSPSTRRIDASAKLVSNFKIPSVHHYLIVDPERRPTIHHKRQSGGTILTSLHPSGQVTLDPPGLVIDVDKFFQ